VDQNGKPMPPRSPVILLPGYKIDVRQPIDSEWRIIWKTGGLQLDFGAGGYSEDEMKAVKKDQILWTQEQTINKHLVRFLYTKSNVLFANFPDLNARFKAHIHNQRELADMLLMVATYNEDWYPLGSAAIAPVPKNQK